MALLGLGVEVEVERADLECLDLNVIGDDVEIFGDDDRCDLEGG